MSKLNDILSFLDDSETKTKSEINKVNTKTNVEINQDFFDEQICEFRKKLEKKKKKELLLKKELQNVLSTSENETEVIKDMIKTKINSQKKRYEETLNRHKYLLNNLLEEKKELSDQYIMISDKLEATKQSVTNKNKRIMEEANLLIKQQKDSIISKEKVRERKIINVKTREMKEITVKGLEPELKSLISRQKNEIDEINKRHEYDLKNARNESEKYLNDEKRKMIEELEKERQSEFILMEGQLKHQLQREKELHRAELERLSLKTKAVEEEKTKTIANAKAESESLLNETVSRLKAELAAEQLRCSKQIENIQKRIDSAIINAKEDARRAAAVREEEIKSEIELETKHKCEIKLQNAIAKLEKETEQIKQSIKHAFDAKIKESQEYSNDNLERIKAEKIMTKREISAIQEKIEQEKALCAKIDKENEKIIKCIESERIHKENVQQEIQAKQNEIENIENEKEEKEMIAKKTAHIEETKLKEELCQCKVILKEKELEWEHKEKQTEENNKLELSSVSKKIKSLIEHRETTISKLTSQISEAQIRLNQIDRILKNQQRIGLKK